MEQVLAGTLTEQARRCGRPGCRCADGEPHHIRHTGRAARRPHRQPACAPARLLGQQFGQDLFHVAELARRRAAAGQQLPVDRWRSFLCAFITQEDAGSAGGSRRPRSDRASVSSRQALSRTAGGPAVARPGRSTDSAA